MFGPHTGYILAAYAAAAVILGALVIGSVLAYRSAQKRLVALETRA